MMGHIRRRDVITLLGGAAAGWPHTGRAQQPTIPLIGSLQTGFPTGTQLQWTATIRQNLAKLGFVEGQNIAFEYRWAEAQFDRLPALAADLVRRRPSIIHTGSPPGALAAKAATTTIPIIFSMGEDPIKEGVVASLGLTGRQYHGIQRFPQPTDPENACTFCVKLCRRPQ